MNAISNKQVSYAASRQTHFGAIVRYEETPFSAIQALLVDRPPDRIELFYQQERPYFSTHSLDLKVYLDSGTNRDEAVKIANAKTREDIHVISQQGDQGFILSGQERTEWEKWL